jgi:hypothetical protein
MKNIRSIFISNVNSDFNANDIMDTLYCQSIATVSRVTLVPNITTYKDILKGDNYNAYIEIANWHETELAYKVIKRLSKSTRAVPLSYSANKWWNIELNTNPEIAYDLANKDATTVNCLVDITGDFIDYQDVRAFDELSALIDQERGSWIKYL